MISLHDPRIRRDQLIDFGRLSVNLMDSVCLGLLSPLKKLFDHPKALTVEVSNLLKSGGSRLIAQDS